MAGRIGETRCLNPKCSCTDVAVNLTAANTLTMICHKCSASSFAKPGTKFRRDMEAPGVIRLDDDQAPAPTSAPAPGPVPVPAPAAKPASGLLI